MSKAVGLLCALFVLLVLLLPAFPSSLQAHTPPGEDHLCQCCDCSTCDCAESVCMTWPCLEASGSGAISLTSGNLIERYRVLDLRSAHGTTIDFYLTYNGNKADGSHWRLLTVLGWGWTHSYNVFLVDDPTLPGVLFRMDADGRLIKYQRGGGGVFRPTPGYFESLVENPDGSFTLTQKDQTTLRFAEIPDTPFLKTKTVWRLTSIVDRNSNSTTLSYSGGHLREIVDTYGRRVTLSYTPNNKPQGITDPLGRTTTLRYQLSARGGVVLSEVTDPEGKSVQYQYDSDDRLTRLVDKDGRIFSYLYNAQGKAVGIQDGAGVTLFRLTSSSNWATDPNAVTSAYMRRYVPSVTRKIDGRGNVWQYAYNKFGYITKITAPDGAITRYAYDPVTLMLVSRTDANGKVTRYEYDALGNRTRTIDALGHVTRYPGARSAPVPPSARSWRRSRRTGTAT